LIDSNILKIRNLFSKHLKANARECFRNGVAPILAKMRFRPKGGIAFLPPETSQPFYS